MVDLKETRKLVKQFEEMYFDYDKVMKEHKITQEDVDYLRERSKSLELIPKATTDRMFLLMLVTCDNDEEKSLILGNNYFKLKRKMPEFFANRDMNSDEIQQCLNNQYYVTLPPTTKNYALIFHKLSNFVSKNYNFDEAVKTFTMTIGNENNDFFFFGFC